MPATSINLRLSNLRAFYHNARRMLVSYLIDDPNRNKVSLGAEEAEQLYLSLCCEAIDNYLRRTGQRIQCSAEKYLWEAVVVIEERHELEDLQRLADRFEEEYGWRTLQIAIHRDEGYADEFGKKSYNYHAHMMILMLDDQGIYRFKKRDFGKKKMAELQSITAMTLDMRRGIPKTLTGTQRLEHRQYREAKLMAEDAILREREMYAEYHEQIVYRLLSFFGQEEILQRMSIAELERFVLSEDDWREELQRLVEEGTRFEQESEEREDAEEMDNTNEIVQEQESQEDTDWWDVSPQIAPPKRRKRKMG